MKITLKEDHKNFCKSFISIHPRCDMINNNVAETFNGYILEARGKHVIDMLEEIRCSLMERQVRKYKEIMVVNDIICPAVRKKLEKLKFESRFCTTHPACWGSFEVHMSAEDKFVVSLDNRTCSCRVWDITRIPCVHAVSAIMYLRRDPASFAHEYYTVKMYLEAYNYGLEPLRGKTMWPQAEGYPVLPPPIKKMPGRPKKKRRDPDERNPKNPNKLSKTGVVMTCRRCMQVGHNVRTCKSEPVEKPPKEKVFYLIFTISSFISMI